MKEYRTERGVFFQGDCMLGMAQYPDKYFDIAIVDPPYGIGRCGTITPNDRYVGNGKGYDFKIKEYEKKEWDYSKPDKIYFDELFRITKEQIIFGINYFSDIIGSFKNYIVWYKKGKSKDNKYNECELAYTSQGINKMVDIWYNGVGVVHAGEDRFHPTQKPVALYKWLVKNYVKQGQRILDTHVGSASSLIAYEDAGLEYVGYELDADYYESAVKRIKDHKMQLNMFPAGIE